MSAARLASLLLSDYTDAPKVSSLTPASMAHGHPIETSRRLYRVQICSAALAWPNRSGIGRQT